MKKTVVSAVFVIVLSISSATGYSQAISQSVGDMNRRPQSVGGGNPRPTGNTAPATSMMITAILMALGLI